MRRKIILSRRSLVSFRRRFGRKDPEMKLVRNVFDGVRDSAIPKTWGFRREPAGGFYPHPFQYPDSGPIGSVRKYADGVSEESG